MRTLKKRLTVVNDGFAKSNIQAMERALKVANRYVTKMMKNGWIPTYECSGNAFNIWEHFIWMSKPSTAKEQKELIELAIDQGWSFSREELSALPFSL